MRKDKYQTIKLKLVYNFLFGIDFVLQNLSRNQNGSPVVLTTSNWRSQNYRLHQNEPSHWFRRNNSPKAHWSYILWNKMYGAMPLTFYEIKCTKKQVSLVVVFLLLPFYIVLVSFLSLLTSSLFCLFWLCKKRQKREEVKI